MRSHKLLIVSATMLATTTVAGVSFADNTQSGTSKSTTSATTPSSSTTTTTTATTPSSTPTPTTGMSQGTPSNGTAAMPPSMPPSTTATSTTTVTSAEDMSTAAAMPPPTSAMPPSGETTVVYQRRRPNTPLLVTGGLLLVGTYATTAAISGANGPIDDRDLFIPVVGPWINIAERSSDRPDNTRDTVLIAGSGVLQGVGALMLITSFFVPESVPAARISAGNVKMQVTPTAAAGAGGIGAVGTF